MRKRKNPACYNCGSESERTKSGQSYCHECHSAYMRKWRPKHKDLPDEARKKANARAYVKVYENRGKIIKKPCEVCGDPKIERHHTDYSKPLQVVYLCKRHHLEAHGLHLQSA